MPRRKKRDKSADGEASESARLGRGMKIVLGIGGVLLAFCIVSSVLSIFQQREAAKRARSIIDELGGKTASYTASAWHFDKIDFAGMPLTDADLARLAAELKDCSGPREFDLSRTQITDAGVESLRDVRRICTLRLDHTKVAGPGLRHLRLGSGSREDPCEVLVSLARTPIDDSGLTHLVGLTELQVLDLTGTKVTGSGLKPLHGIKDLHTVRLIDCPVDDGTLAALDGWTTLYTLDLRGTRITDAGLKRIAGLKQLQTLSIAATPVTEPGLANLAGLSKLTALTLDDTTLGDGALPVLRSTLRLQALSLNGTRITDAGLEDLANWDALSSLHLEHTAITDAGLAHLQRVPMLHRVVLTNARTTQAGRDALKQAKPGMLIDW
jgi:hypothetical protein